MKLRRPNVEVPLPPSDGPAILVYDIETAPALVYTWSYYQTNVIATERDWYVLCFAAQWLGSDDVFYVGLPDNPRYRPTSQSRHDDRYVLDRLWRLFDLADVTVAHNGDRFDLKKGNARFWTRGFEPPSPSASIDTLKETKRYFANYSNKLTELARQLELSAGEKLAHSGVALWRACMDGDLEAWNEMEAYNRQDVVILTELYQRLIPWLGSPGKAGAGVNATKWSTGDHVIECPTPGCGGDHLIRRGTWTSKAGLRYQRFQCKRCRGYCRARYRDREYGDGAKVK